MSSLKGNALFTSLNPLVEGPGEGVLGDGVVGLFPLLSHIAGVHNNPLELPLDCGEKEEVCRSQIRRVGRVVDHLDARGIHEFLWVFAGMAGGIVHVQKPFPCDHGWLFAPENLQGVGEDITEVLRVDRGLFSGTMCW